VANAMAGMVQRVAPLAFEAWLDYTKGAATFSAQERRVLEALLDSTEHAIYARAAGPSATVAREAVGISKREWDELRAKLSAPTLPQYALDLSTMHLP